LRREDQAGARKENGRNRVLNKTGAHL